MKIYKAYKTELDLNNKQKSKIEMFFGGARFAYNWALKNRIELYEQEKKNTTYFKQDKEFNKLKKTEEYKWTYLYSSRIFQEVLLDLDNAYKNFFRNLKQNKQHNFPKFKSKKNNKQSFRLKGTIYIFENKVRLPKLGELKLKQKNYIPINKHILYVTISKKVNKYFISVTIEEEINLKENNSNKILGIDVGIKNLIIDSDGLIFNNPKIYNKYLKKLKREQRKLSKKEKGSNNREKQRIKLAKLHFKIANIRKDNIHKMTTTIVEKQPKAIVIENLKINNMIKNHKLAQFITDSSFSVIRRQLEYKTKWNNIELIHADTFYPSSKLCSNCGNKKDNLTLKDRIYICDKCGFKIDRDLNAAINLSKYTVSSTGINAFGEDKLQINSNINGGLL